MQPFSPETWNAEALAGQRLMLGFEGPECHAAVRSTLARIRPAGMVLFTTNVRTKEQLTQLIGDLKAAAQAEGLPPLIIAIDQEGGPVARLRMPAFREFPGIADFTGPREAALHAQAMAEELKSLGITMNLAPVLDVASHHPASIIRHRAFQGDAARVSAMGLAVIRAYQENGIAAVAKHFPGIGRTVLDSHHVLPYLDAKKSLLAQTDFLPFQAAIQAQVAGVMVSHILYEKLDPAWPASLSTRICRDLLRKEMGYEGLVMTDDLDMKAIRLPMDLAMARLVEAQVDLGLICHEGPAIEEAFKALTDMAQNPEKRPHFIRSAQRILALKEKTLPKPSSPTWS